MPARTRWREVVQFAQAHECAWSRDPAIDPANWGIHHVDTPPHNRLLGPVAARGPVSGLVQVGSEIRCRWGEPERADFTFSVAKTYLALLAGVAYREGLIDDPAQPVVETVPGIGFDDGSARLVTWEHLLQQTSEWGGTCFGVPDQVDRYRRTGFQPPPAPGEATGPKGGARPLGTPGSFWEYNDVRINQLSLALLHVFREPLPVVFGRELMQPIGASTDWRWHGYDNSWVEVDGRRLQSVPGGTHWGGGLQIGAQDQLRLARLMLQQGRHGDTALLNADWMARMLAPCPIADFYGYLTWLNTGRRMMPSASAESFFAIGAGGAIVWHDPATDITAVFRWLDADAADGLIARILAAC